MQVGRIEYSPDYRAPRFSGTLDDTARQHVEGVSEKAIQTSDNDNFTPAEARELVGLASSGRLYRNTEPRDGFVDDGIVPIDVWGPSSAGGDVFPEPRRGDWLQLYSGKRFWPTDPHAEDVEIDDIAHSLSMQCRYAGHCVKFYSVAEHSVHIADWLYVKGFTSDQVIAGLLHDATEAYLVDVPRPVKPFLPGYKEAEAAVWQAVATRFELPVEMPAIVKEVYSRIIGDERANMRHCAADWYATGEPLGIELQYWSPAEAEARFLDRFRTVERARQWIRRAA